MKVIGITGGVGCGKSAILNELKKNYSCFVLLADEAAKELEKRGNVCFLPLVELLGKNILGEDGEINSGRMSAVIFDNPSLLDKVNDIVHPAVKDYILSTISQKASTGLYDYFFLEAALLIECGYNEVVDEMWYIFTDEKIRRERLKKTRGYSDEKIDSIMRSQLSEEEFRAGSDFTVDNSGDIDKTMSQIYFKLGFPNNQNGD